MEAYASREYSRLKMDKYIESNRALDLLAANLCNRKPAMVYIGAAVFSPNSPIRIPKYVRCPGTRKMSRSFKKCGSLVHFVDEYNTSQHCGRCGQRFRPALRPKHFKVCGDTCVPHPALMVPKLIVSELPNRLLRADRRNFKDPNLVTSNSH